METTLPELLLASMLVGAATLACRRWGNRIGGLVSALPAVVGPLLLITAQQHGAAFTARAANGTLLGLAGLGAFALAYGRAAVRAGWGVSLVAGWAAAAVVAAVAGSLGGGLGFPGGLAIAAVSLTFAYRALPPCAPEASISPDESRAWGGIALRMALTAALVAILAAAATLFGAVAGGMLAGLPVLASVLALATHRRDGAAATVALLRGMLSGMSGFVCFCVAVEALIVPAGIAAAFITATLATLGLHALLWRARDRGSALALLRRAFA
ncbi:MAG TPA: hypothetical protein VKT31_02465 [Solirubrobacteraceae bacterium]|nr:hypothetical protein [Solirubrobacteraceae bacterium]